MAKRPRAVRVVERVEVERWEYTCAECGVRFLGRQPPTDPRYGDARYCKPACRYRAWAREHRPPGQKREAKKPRAKS